MNCLSSCYGERLYAHYFVVLCTYLPPCDCRQHAVGQSVHVAHRLHSLCHLHSLCYYCNVWRSYDPHGVDLHSLHNACHRLTPSQWIKVWERDKQGRSVTINFGKMWESVVIPEATRWPQEAMLEVYGMFRKWWNLLLFRCVPCLSTPKYILKNSAW